MENLNPFAKLEKLKKLPRYIPEEECKDNSKETEENDFKPDIKSYNLDEQIDTEHGLTKRIKSVFAKHWDKSLPLIHFTNDLTNYGPGTKVRSTNFVKSITKEGLNKYSNVGFIPSTKMLPEIEERFKEKDSIDLNIVTEEEAKNYPLKFLEAINRIRKEFVHHGLRVNKNKVSGTVSIPAVIILENGVRKQAGDDKPIHAQIDEKIEPEKIIGVFQFDPCGLISSYMEGRVSDKRSIKKEKIMFRKELSGNDKNIRNEFLKQFLEQLSNFRLKELKALYDYIDDEYVRNKIVLAAHDLVDIYILSPEKFDNSFPEINQATKKIIE